MARALAFLRAHARRLHRCIIAEEPRALARARRLPEFHERDDASIRETIRRRHCLAIVARELGFGDWPHAVAVISGERSDDFGTLLYPRGADAFWNIWSASYDEARSIRAEHGGYLLAYKRHYFIVEPGFIEALGLDPNDPDWEAMGRDWVAPRDTDARERQYAKLFERRMKGAAA